MINAGCKKYVYFMSEGEQVTPYGKVEPDYYSRKHFPAGTPITPVNNIVIFTAIGQETFSEATAHLYEQGERLAYASAGSSALAPETKTNGKTYNFTTTKHHTYIADGVRVHNVSILATLEEGDTLAALNNNLTNAAGSGWPKLRPVAVHLELIT